MKKIVTMILSSVCAMSLLIGLVLLLYTKLPTDNVVVAESVDLGPTSADASYFGIEENPGETNTTRQYIWNASQSGKLYKFMPTYIISKQTEWDGNLANSKTHTVVGIHLNSNVNFKSDQVNSTWQPSNNAGYIYYGSAYDTPDEDLLPSTKGDGTPGGGICYSGRGGTGWLAYKAYVRYKGAFINPKKIVFKKGFAIVMSNDDVYALAEDVAVYNINGAYLSAQTTDGFLSNATAYESSKNKTDNVTITGVSYSSGQLTLTTNTSMQTAPGSYGVVSEDIGLNGENVSSWGGSVTGSNSKQLIFKNVSMSLKDGDKLCINQGLTIIWGNSTWIYTVKLTAAFWASYNGSSFAQVTQGTRDGYVWKAQYDGKYNEITPKAITSVQLTDSSNTLKNNGGVTIFIDTDKDLASSNIVWANNAGYIYYGTTYDTADEDLQVSTNGNGAQSGGYAFGGAGGVGRAVYILNVKQSSYTASKPAKVVLKAGFILALEDGTVFSLNGDYTLYNVNGIYLPAKDLAGLQEKYTGTIVDTVEIRDVVNNSSYFTFVTNKTLSYSGINPCGIFGTMTLQDSALSTWGGGVVESSTQFNLSGISSSPAIGDELTMSDFSVVFYSATNDLFYVVKADEETAFRYTSGGFIGRYTVTQTIGGEEITTKVFPGDSYELGTESNNGKIFIGWNVNDVLKQANTSVVVNGNLTIVPQWIDYSLNEGAYIRLTTNADTSGIRFVAELNKDSYYEANSKYIKKIGIIMMPNDMLSEKDFTLENYTTAGSASNSALDFYLASDDFSFTADGTLSLGATVQKMVQANFARDVRARAYVVVNYGGENVYIYADNSESNVISIYYLAQAWLELHADDPDSIKKDIAQAYVDYVENK